MKLSRSYVANTNDSSIVDSECRTLYLPFSSATHITLIGLTAISQIFRVIEEQSQASWDEDFNFISYYNWTGGNGALSPAVNNAGNGEPKGYTGLVGTHHRPSDDLSTFGASIIISDIRCVSNVEFSALLTPANAMLAVELTNLANMLDGAGLFSNISTLARNVSERVTNAIWNTTVCILASHAD